MANERLLLAFDFGGTKHTAAVIALKDSCVGEDWLAHQRVFSPPGADARYDIQTMISLGRELLGGAQPSAVGVSFGGPVDAATGTVRLSHHVPGWENTPLAALLKAEFRAPVQVDNDANVAALGEHRFGSGQSADSLLYITVSTGVGGGWILNRKMWHGVDSMAGEIGHTVVDPMGPVCLCGKRGCVERLASGPYMAEDAQIALENGAHSEKPERGQRLLALANGDKQGITAQLIAQAAAQGDVLAAELLERSAWALGTAIGNAANLVNPGLFILGGGVTKSGSRFWDTLRRVARETALPEVNFDVLPAALGDDAPLWGAAALAGVCLAEN